MSVFYAQIPVSKCGYTWIGNENSVYATLISNHERPLPPSSDNSAWRNYDPFVDEPALFRVFADLEIFEPLCYLSRDEIKKSRKTIQEFVCRYGEVQCFPLVSAFGLEVQLMHDAIQLWDAISSKDQKILDKYLHFFRAGEYSYQSPEFPYRRWLRHGMVARRGWSPWLRYVRKKFGSPQKLQGWGLRETLVAAAIEDVPEHWHGESRANKKEDLLACATELFIRLVQSRSGSNVCVSLAQAPGASQLAVRIKIDSLLQAMWLQLAVSLTEHHDYRRCRTCNKPFAVGSMPNGKTVPKDKQFCNVTCRVNGLHRRQVRARKMRAEHVPLRQIAKEVDSDVETVKGWLGEKG